MPLAAAMPCDALQTPTDPRMDRMTTPLLERSWRRAWQDLGARRSGEELRLALLARYGEPHRHYHGRQHLAECLAAFEPVAHLAHFAAEVEMALWFHDAIHAVRRSDNEAQSAEWASEALREAGVAPEVRARVHALIMATRHAAVPVAADEQLLADIDLGILAADRARFADYEQQIRREYAFVPGWLFKRKRRAVLAAFLERPRIYGTDHFHAALETRARRNLAHALARPAG